MLSLFAQNPRSRADIAIDLGTANTRVIGRGAGVLFDQPSLCCFADDGARSRVVAVGDAAKRMVDRTSGALRIRQPLARGVLQDIDAARELLQFAVRSSIGRRRFGAPRAMIGVPADATNAECAALQTAAADSGLRDVRLVREPLAAAFGAELPVNEATGSMIVECGAGTTEVAVFSLGGFCLTRSVRGGGLALDAALAAHIHFHHHFLIGGQTAERFKRKIVELLAQPASDELSIEVNGRSIRDGKPGTLTLRVGELRPVVAKHANQIVEAVRQVLHQTPPQLSHDICSAGIVLTGGSALDVIAETISRDTGLPVSIAEHQDRCVTHGLGALLNA
jgi:rod shape-determining protein MreB